MTFIIPEEELTNDGPYSLGPSRVLNGLEIVYTEMILQMELKKSWETVDAPTSTPRWRSSPIAEGEDFLAALRASRGINE